MATVEAPVFWLLFEPKGIPDDAIASTTAERPMFNFKIEGGTLVLHTNPLEIPDPWGVRPIQFFPELVCVNHPLVLIRIRSTDNRYPTCFYVYNLDSRTFIKLPKVAPEIWASQSFGLVHHRSASNRVTYFVANLQREYNHVTKQVEVFLHRWWCSGSSWQSKLNDKVTLLSSIKVDMGKWLPDQVITFKDALLWVDLSQGVILRCKNPLQNCEADFDCIRLPCSKRVLRPQTFMSVGCCNGELKLVKIDDTSDVHTVYVTIMTFNEQSYARYFNKRLYWDTASSNSLICRDLCVAMKNMPGLQLPSDWNLLKNHMPCFPVMNTCKDNILHLIMARKDNMGAWLLQVNTQSWVLERAAAYPGFSNHQKPPCSSSFYYKALHRRRSIQSYIKLFEAKSDRMQAMDVPGVGRSRSYYESYQM